MCEELAQSRYPTVIPRPIDREFDALTSTPLLARHYKSTLLLLY